MTKEKFKAEFQKLVNYRIICENALSQFAHNENNQLPEIERRKISEVLDRLFDSELEFLQSQPNDYFEIYS
jgi:hypothetical protein